MADSTTEQNVGGGSGASASTSVATKGSEPLESGQGQTTIADGVVTKVAGGGRIYQAPRHLSARRINVLRPIAPAPALVTGGDFAPSGHRFVLRTYNRAYFYSRLKGRPQVVTLPSERQGEAIGFTRRGSAVKVASEGLDQPIWRVAR